MTVGLPYSFRGQFGADTVRCGSPYGATTMTDDDGSRLPSVVDLEGARFQDALVAATATRLFGV